MIHVNWTCFPTHILREKNRIEGLRVGSPKKIFAFNHDYMRSIASHVTVHRGKQGYPQIYTEGCSFHTTTNEKNRIKILNTKPSSDEKCLKSQHAVGRGNWISVFSRKPGLQDVVPGQPPKPQRKPVSQKPKKNYEHNILFAYSRADSFMYCSYKHLNKLWGIVRLKPKSFDVWFVSPLFHSP